MCMYMYVYVCMCACDAVRMYILYNYIDIEFYY